MDTLGARSQPGRGIGAPLQAQIRLLRPLRLAQRDAGAAAQILLASRPLGVAGAWRLEPPRHLYRDEISPQVAALVGVETDGAYSPLAGRYLRVDPVVAARWFHQTVLNLGPSRQLDVKLEPSTGIELFVSGHGVGVLSITLCLPDHSPAPVLLDVAHGLARAQRRSRHPVCLATPHPRDDAERWARIPEEEKAKLAEPPPAEDAPLAERVGRRGGRFTLIELTDELLASVDGPRADESDSMFIAYSCWRFDETVDFTDADTRRRHLVAASSAAQVEEASHASGAGIDETAETATLNTRHVAAVAAQGAAHLVADQTGVPFNQERLARVRDKYFMPFLAALLARTIARRLGAGAAVAVHRAGDDPAVLGELRRAVLDFTLCGAPLEASTRAVINRFYGMVERAMNARGELARVDRALASLDALAFAERQERLAQRTAISAETSIWMQRNIEWIEIFIVLVYSAELVHLFVAMHEGGHSGMEAVMVSGLAVGAAVLAALILRPWKHRAKSVPDR